MNHPADLVEVDKVFRLGAPPQVAMILAFIVEESAGIADPSSPCAEMILISIVFVIETVCFSRRETGGICTLRKRF
jgi:hypothetical protein